MTKIVSRKISFIFLSIILLSCSGIEPIQSGNTSGEIIVDGIAAEWESGMKILKEENMSIGIRNDADNIYLIFITADKNKILKMAMRGTVVWFEPENKDDMLGVLFPEKMELGALRDLKNTGESNNYEKSLEERINQYLSSSNEITILDKNENVLQKTQSSKTGLEAAMKFSNGQLVYELKMPISEKNTSSIILNSSKELSINLATMEIDEEEVGNRMQNMPRGEGGQGNPGGGMRRGGGGAMQRDFTPLDLNFKVVLIQK